ncbi:MAG: DUF3322 domain-containing protein, partial [Chloroflexota bacterium]
MHSQAYLRKRARARYHDFLHAWLTEEDFFPLAIFVGKVDVKNYAQLQEAVDTLHQHSKAVLGYGYIIDSDIRRTRQLGEQSIPHHIVFEKAEDYLRYLGNGKLREFENFVTDVASIRSQQPQLENWLRRNIKNILKYQGKWEDLLSVCQYFLEYPQPQKYLRELPIEAHTKFIEDHQTILDQLLQHLLPSSSYDTDAEDFNTRYGIRNKSSLIRIRLLDVALKSHPDLPFMDFAVPLETLKEMAIPIEHCIIVENEINFLTVPLVKNTICIWGAGFRAIQLQDIPWLTKLDILYWGDVDVQGFQILSALRKTFPHTRSSIVRLRGVATVVSVPITLNCPNSDNVVSSIKIERVC